MKIIQIKNLAINYLKKAFNEGFLLIFLSNALAKVVAFLGGTILINILTKNDYGIYSYILNTLSILSILGDCGAGNATMQFSSENSNDKTKRNAYINLGIKMSLMSSMLSCLLILLSPYFFPYSIEGTSSLTQMLFLIPILVNTNTLILGIVRSQLQNKKFAVINIFSTVAHYVFLIPFSFIGGLIGAVLAQYFFNGATVLFGLILSFGLFKYCNYKNCLKIDERKEFIKFSLATQLNSTIDSFLVAADLFLIGLIIANSETIALYKTASILPNALLFIPTSIMIFLIPYFARNNKNIVWIKKYTQLIVYGGMITFGIISIVFIVFAPLIITMLFGDKYADSVLCFRILMVGFFFSASFKLPLNNIIYTMKKVKINIIATLIGGITNILIDPILIYYLGSVGAAITTCFVMIVNSIFVCLYMKNLLKKELPDEIYKKS